MALGKTLHWVPEAERKLLYKCDHLSIERIKTTGCCYLSHYCRWLNISATCNALCTPNVSALSWHSHISNVGEGTQWQRAPVGAEIRTPDLTIMRRPLYHPPPPLLHMSPISHSNFKAHKLHYVWTLISGPYRTKDYLTLTDFYAAFFFCSNYVKNLMLSFLF